MKTIKGYCVRIYNYSDDNHYNIISTEDSYYRDQYEAWDYKQQCLDYLTEEELALTDSDSPNRQWCYFCYKQIWKITKPSRA